MKSLVIDRWSLLAAVRFSLALVVVLTHLHHYTGAKWAETLGSAAFEAISGFLVISGYSIASSYASRPRGFYFRRALRVYPAYVVAMAATIYAVGVPSVSTILINLLFLNQIVTRGSFVGPAWTLALEVWLYALTPLLARSSVRAVYLVSAASLFSFMIHTVLRTLLQFPYFSGVGYAGNLLLLSFPWLLGFSIGAHVEKRRPLIFLIAAMFLSLGLSCLIQLGFRLKHGELTTFLSVDSVNFAWRGFVLAFAPTALFAIVNNKVGVVRSRNLNVLGDISYALYLLHIPIFIISVQSGLRSPLALLALALLGAAVITAVVEFPIRRLAKEKKPGAMAAVS